jgi:hypothetical protein
LVDDYNARIRRFAELEIRGLWVVSASSVKRFGTGWERGVVPCGLGARLSVICCSQIGQADVQAWHFILGWFEATALSQSPVAFSFASDSVGSSCPLLDGRRVPAEVIVDNVSTLPVQVYALLTD